MCPPGPPCSRPTAAPRAGADAGGTESWRPGLSRSALYGQRRLGLDALCTPSRCDLQAMGGIQLLDERELHCLPLGHQQAGWAPARGPVEDHVHYRALLGCSRCGRAGAKQHNGQKPNEPAEMAAPTRSEGSEQPCGYGWRISFKVLEVRLLASSSQAFLPSKPAWGAHRLRHF